ncbi:MAG: Hsp20/alpha crystallin family protein, partial [Thermodesulfobacteriota bacterium]
MVLDFSTLYDFPGNIERIYDQLFNPLEISQRKFAYPPLNITEDNDNIYVRAELPGVDIEDIDLSIAQGSLIIKGERKPEQGRYFRQERPTGSFQRVVNLNVKIDNSKVGAKMKDGILTVTLPKSEEVKTQKIN